MTSLTQTLTPLRQRMIDDMRMRKLSPKTQASYIRVVKRFAGYLGRSPDTASVEDLRSYQLYLVDHGISPIFTECDSHRTQVSLCNDAGSSRIID